jgi:hypothetical protein
MLAAVTRRWLWLLLAGLAACRADPRLATFPARPGEAIELRRSSTCEVTCSVTYRAIKDGVRVAGDRVVGYVRPGVAVALENLAPAGSGLVAVVEASAPDVLLALHDFSSGRSWPADEGAGLVLLEQLRGVRPGSYVLASAVPGNRELKLAP